MADFNIAIKDTLTKEGAYNKKLGYVNDPRDRGGETVAGIARKFWGHLPLWKIVDSYKKHPRFPFILKDDKELWLQILAFYKKEFWDRIGGDSIDSQSIADMILGSGVHEGFVPAIKRAEIIVGIEPTGKFSEELKDKLNAL